VSRIEAEILVGMAGDRDPAIAAKVVGMILGE
jgi:hypothetical protein